MKGQQGAPVTAAVVGFGYWGPNIARNFEDAATVELRAICDSRSARIDLARRRHPRAEVTDDFDRILADDAIEAVAIATPVSSHAELACRALQAGKHVLVSKPLAGCAAEARRVVAAAEQAGRVLLVDHTFVFMGAVRKVRELVRAGELGELYYYDSVRVNLGLFQHDVSVVWDLAVHDLSILSAWVPERPRAVSCTGISHVEGHPPDTAYLTLFYDSTFIAHINVNWLSPVKIRRTLLGGSRKMVVFDDLDSVEKIRLYDRGITTVTQPVDPGLVPIAYRRTGDVWIPQIDLTEALAVETAHFTRCIRQGEEPWSRGEEALTIVEILDAAEESMKLQGHPVELVERSV